MTNAPSADHAQIFAAALARHDAGDSNGAESGYRAVLALDADHFDALINLGNVLAVTGRTTEAAELYRRAAKTMPGHPLPAYNLAKLNFDSGDFATAMKILNAVPEDRHIDDTQLLLATAALRAGYSDATRELIDTVLARTPESAPALELLGLLEEALGNYGQAANLFRRVLDSDPTRLSALRHRSRLR